tara:strand:- start:893 stop:1093 length:201 start_codon:yes stop_codon:yes gene_type:complete
MLPPRDNMMEITRTLTETRTRMIANEKRMEKVEQAVDGIKSKVQMWNGIVLAGLALLPLWFSLWQV